VHPNKAFAWPDQEQLLAFITETVVGHIFASTTDGLMVAHAPVIVAAPDRLRFHLAKPNRLVKHLDGASAVISFMGTNAYQSADWYEAKDQVPTWLYRAMEVEGIVRQMDQEGLIAQVDALSAQMEERLLPKKPWTREKMPEGKFASILPFITGFEVEVTAMRGTKKLNQHKGAEDVAAMIDGQRTAGRADIVALVEAAVAAR
jgi:transcriptional regulator